ncbi:MAG: tripartite tricarboxylate transporter substrate binding protein [Pseudomonadota bacterium]
MLIGRILWISMSVLLLCATANAQTYPTRNISLTVPYAAGGASDIVGREIANRLTAQLGHTVFVENRPGASGNLGSMFVARSAPDGYQLLSGSNGPQAINVALLGKLPYDPVRDLKPIAMIAEVPVVLVVAGNSSIRTVKDLIAFIRASKKPVSYGSAGNASTPHLAGEYFRQLAGLELTHVPYKGDAGALTDLVGGHIELSFPALASALPLIKAGKLRALAVSSARRNSLLPDVPSMKESGLPQYEMVGWYGLFAPKDIPEPLVTKLVQEVRVSLADSKLRQQFAAVGVEPASSIEGEAFARFQAEQIEKYRVLIREAKITAD